MSDHTDIEKVFVGNAVDLRRQLAEAVERAEIAEAVSERLALRNVVRHRLIQLMLDEMIEMNESVGKVMEALEVFAVAMAERQSSPRGRLIKSLFDELKEEK